MEELVHSSRFTVHWFYLNIWIFSSNYQLVGESGITQVELEDWWEKMEIQIIKLFRYLVFQ